MTTMSSTIDHVATEPTDFLGVVVQASYGTGNQHSIECETPEEAMSSTIDSIGSKRTRDEIADDVDAPDAKKPDSIAPAPPVVTPDAIDPVAPDAIEPVAPDAIEPVAPDAIEPVVEAVDLGHDAFNEFGLHHIVTRGISASVVRVKSNVERTEEVILKVDDIEQIGGKMDESTILAHWSKYAVVSKNKIAMFRGGVATSLARMIDAVSEATVPGIALILLNEIKPSSVRNNFKDPNRGQTASPEEYTLWKKRDAVVTALCKELNTRIAIENIDELATMHTNRRMYRSIIDRGGSLWESYIPYIKEARKPTDGEINLPKALLTMYVFNVQIDGWGQTMRGSKKELRVEVAGLKREILEQLEVEYNGRV